MDLVKKFRLNTIDFQIYFDNDKKTYVALNIETGEKTNVGVLGIFLQMGILKHFEEIEKKDAIIQRLEALESKVTNLMKVINNSYQSTDEEIENTVEESQEEIEEKIPKSEVAQNILEKTLKKISVEKEKPKEESDDEYANWIDI